MGADFSLEQDGGVSIIGYDSIQLWTFMQLLVNDVTVSDII
jgi:hypothetical protein